jgi:ABC-type transporter Mla subunit MlaD
MELKEKIEIKRHEEVVKAMNGVKAAIASLPKDDLQLKKLIENTNQAINNFGNKVDQLNGAKAPEVNVETNQDKVVQSINSIFKELIPALNSINERLTKLENRPLPTKLKPVRSGYPGTIDYVIVEYKK